MNLFSHMSPGAIVLVMALGFGGFQAALLLARGRLKRAYREFETRVASRLPGFNPWEAHDDE